MANVFAFLYSSKLKSIPELYVFAKIAELHITKGIHPIATRPIFHYTYRPIIIPQASANTPSSIVASPSILAPFKQDISLAKTFTNISGEWESLSNQPIFFFRNDE